MTELSIVGGCLIMMSGISILGFKADQNVDFLLPPPCPFFGARIAPLLSHLL